MVIIAVFTVKSSAFSLTSGSHAHFSKIKGQNFKTHFLVVCAYNVEQY